MGCTTTESFQCGAGAGGPDARQHNQCHADQGARVDRVVKEPHAQDEGVGNAQINGSWQLTNNKKSTHIVLTVEGEVTLPFPSLMKMVVQPVVEAEFERLTEEYIANLCERFGGEVEA